MSKNMKNLIIFECTELFYEKVPWMGGVNKVQLQYNLWTGLNRLLTTTESDVRKELEYQPQVSVVLDDIHTPKITKIKRSDPALWSKVGQKNYSAYGPKKVQLSN
jgi:hypothetical protein